MPRFRVPFGNQYESGSYPETFAPGAVMATIAETAQAGSGSREKGTWEDTVATPWGDINVEARGTGEVMVQTPHADIPGPPVMRQAACQRLGLDPTLVGEAGSIDVVDVGVRVLVAPLPSADAVRNAQERADVSGIPMVDTDQGATYALTQRSPYVKILARPWGPVDPLVAAAAAGRHLVTTKGFRPTYPRTRIVARFVGEGEETCEVTVQAEKVSGQAKVTRVLVGGEVAPVPDGAPEPG